MNQLYIKYLIRHKVTGSLYGKRGTIFPSQYCEPFDSLCGARRGLRNDGWRRKKSDQKMDEYEVVKFEVVAQFNQLKIYPARENK